MRGAIELWYVSTALFARRSISVKMRFQRQIEHPIGGCIFFEKSREPVTCFPRWQVEALENHQPRADGARRPFGARKDRL